MGRIKDLWNIAKTKEVSDLIPAVVPKTMDKIISPWARKGIVYGGLPLAAYAMADAANKPEYGAESENDDARWNRISNAHMAGGGMLGGLLGLSGAKLLAPGGLRLAAPFIGAAIGTGIGSEVTAPFHYLQSWKTRAARRAPYPGGASAAAGLPFVVAPEDISMGPDEMRRRQLLGF